MLNSKGRLMRFLCTFLTANFLAWATATHAISLTDDLVAHYPFDGNADDISGNDNHGTVFGATFTSGKFGQAGSFDGVNDYIRFPALNNGSKTFALWFKTTTTDDNGFARLLSTDEGVGEDLWALFVNKGTLNASARETTAGFVPQLNSGSIVNDNQWHFGAVTMNTSTNEMRLYVDGNLRASSNQMTAALTMFDHEFYAMRDNFHDRYTSGEIDEVRIWDRALSSNEVAAVSLGISQPPTIVNYDGTITHPLAKPISSIATNAVIMVHGHKDSPSLYTTSGGGLGATNMKQSLEGFLANAGISSQWDVHAYDWQEDAALAPGELTNPPSERAKNEAQLHGQFLAQEIIANGYDNHVHRSLR